MPVETMTRAEANERVRASDFRKSLTAMVATGAAAGIGLAAEPIMDYLSKYQIDSPENAVVAAMAVLFGGGVGLMERTMANGRAYRRNPAEYVLTNYHRILVR